MDAHAGESEAITVEGRIRWNEFEGGFWSLELDQAHTELSEHVVLSGFELPAEAAEDAHVRMRVRPRPDLVDFTMAGVRVEVLHSELLD